MNDLIIGVGTGRCGTSSLASLLSAQPGWDATHERYGPRVRWGCPPNTWPLRLWRETLQKDSSAVADIALNWTPHVEWFLEKADETGRTARVIGLKRGREDTIDSYERWVGPNVNHWQRHQGQEWEYHDWDWCFPAFDQNLSRHEAIGRFWDHVYDYLESISDERVQVFGVEALNDQAGVDAILQHVGVADKNLRVGVTKNVTS